VTASSANSKEVSETLTFKSHIRAAKIYSTAACNSPEVSYLQPRNVTVFSASQFEEDGCKQRGAFFITEAQGWVCASVFDLSEEVLDRLNPAANAPLVAPAEPVLQAKYVPKEAQASSTTPTVVEKPEEAKPVTQASEKEVVGQEAAAAPVSSPEIVTEHALAQVKAAEVVAAKPSPVVQTKRPGHGSVADPVQGEEPQERLMTYGTDEEAFAERVRDNEWQKAYPDRRNFAVFARNYSSRVSCAGEIQTTLHPTTKGLELQLENGNKDLFIRVSPGVPDEIKHFPVDMTFICEGNVYQVVGIVDSRYLSTNLRLVTNDMTEYVDPRFHKAVAQAENLPHEDKILKILKRVYNDDHMAYWKVKKSQAMYHHAGVDFQLRAVVNTMISDIIAYDFVVSDAAMNEGQLVELLGREIEGRIIGLGRVQFGESQRVILVATKDE